MCSSRYVGRLTRLLLHAKEKSQQTRSLAREQFLKKALIKKIAKGMALDEYQMR
jgi:hypothetical protein